MKGSLVCAALAAGGLVAVAGPVQAASVVQNKNYDFALNFQLPESELQSYAALIVAPEFVFAGQDQVLFQGFDTTLGTLTRVTLEGDMTVSGVIFTRQQVSGYAEGSFAAGSLFIDLPFENYTGDPNNNQVNISEFDSGSDTTTSGLAFFSGNAFLADIAASFEYGYTDGSTDGFANPFTAEGTLTLTYEYTNGDPGPTPNPIPTPAAAAAGLALLAALAVRRRDRA